MQGRGLVFDPQGGASPLPSPCVEVGEVEVGGLGEVGGLSEVGGKVGGLFLLLPVAAAFCVRRKDAAFNQPNSSKS